MKSTLTIFCAVGIFFANGAFSQNCDVTISGGSCVRAMLTANVNDELSELRWYWGNSLVFTSDAISSPSSIAIVAGNHGTGAAANQFRFPSGGIAVDTAGNIYVADILNHRVQKWAPGAAAGVTVAGGNGQGSAANQLSNPRDVFVDAAGNVYVSDGANHRIQKWVPGAAAGVTVAGGNGSGFAANQLSGPRGIYVDKQGNIYIADAFNYRIQRWKAGATKGTTVAGGKGPGHAANQLQFPIDVYLDAAKNVYVADANLDDASNHRVQKWAPGDTAGVTVAGGNGEGNAANQFGYLLGIFVDKDGTVYAADNGVSGVNIGRIQKWLPGAQNGVTVAGGHTAGDVLSYPTGVALGKGGKLYVLDGIYSPKIQQYKLTNGKVNTKFSPTQPGAYTVQAAFVNGCTATSPVKVMYAIPQTPIMSATETGSRGNLCEGGIDTFFVAAWDDITTYKWTVPKNCTLVASKNDSIIINVPAGYSNGRLTVKGRNVCGVGNPDTLSITGRPLKPGLVTGLRRVFPNQVGLVYSILNDGLAHNWAVPADATIQSGQGTNSIVVNWGALPGIVAVNSTNSCGSSLNKEIAISLRNTVAAGALNNAAIISSENNNAVVFPNPAKGNITVRFTSDKQMSYTIELQNMQGIVLLQKNIFAAKGLNSLNLYISNYASGVYLINIKNAEKKIQLKLIKE